MEVKRDGSCTILPAPPFTRQALFSSMTRKKPEILQAITKRGFSIPTLKALEDKRALLEGGESAVAFSPGMAAICSVLLDFLRPGDEVISSRQTYAGSRGFFENTLKKLGCPVRYSCHDKPTNKGDFF
jgi:O-acetylhomoserine/O-acetylserine sulfhydrylase-like pyridoxal-dependent enzyme